MATTGNPYDLKGGAAAAYYRNDWDWFNHNNKYNGAKYDVAAMQASRAASEKDGANKGTPTTKPPAGGTSPLPKENGTPQAPKPPEQPQMPPYPGMPYPGMPAPYPGMPYPGAPYPGMPDYSSQISQLQQMMTQMASQDPWSGFFEKLQAYQAQQEAKRKEEENKFNWNNVLYGGAFPTGGYGSSVMSPLPGMGGGLGGFGGFGSFGTGLGGRGGGGYFF